MTNVSELANVPREIQVGDLTLKVRQLKIKELFGYFEQKIKNKKIKEAHEMSEMLPPDEKRAFLLDAWKTLPSGAELTDQVTDTIASVEGVCDILYLASKDCVEVDLDTIRDAVDIKSLDGLAPIINWVTGMEEKDTEKKTEKTKAKK